MSRATGAAEDADSCILVRLSCTTDIGGASENPTAGPPAPDSCESNHCSLRGALGGSQRGGSCGGWGRDRWSTPKSSGTAAGSSQISALSWLRAVWCAWLPPSLYGFVGELCRDPSDGPAARETRAVPEDLRLADEPTGFLASGCTLVGRLSCDDSVRVDLHVTGQCRDGRRNTDAQLAANKRVQEMWFSRGSAVGEENRYLSGPERRRSAIWESDRRSMRCTSLVPRSGPSLNMEAPGRAPAYVPSRKPCSCS